MSVIVLLIAAGGVVAAGFLAAFAWAVRSGQFDDMTTPAVRMLLEPRRPTLRPSSGTDERRPTLRPSSGADERRPPLDRGSGRPEQRRGTDRFARRPDEKPASSNPAEGAVS